VSGSEKRGRRDRTIGRRRGAATAAKAPESSFPDVERSPRGAGVGAFFDLDRTLIAGFSAVAFLGGWLLSGRMGPLGLLRTVLATLRFRAGSIGFSAFVAETAEFLTGYSEARYRELAEKIFTRWLSAEVFPEARALIRAHRQRGHSIAVVSSATRYQIEPIARELGVRDILCTELEVRDGVFTGEVRHPACFREGKHIAARRFAESAGIDLAKSFFYTDSRDDLALLNAVGHPRPTNPDRKLAAVAAKRGWPVRRFSSRGIPAPENVARTLLAIGSMAPSLALGLPAALLNGDSREAVNLGQTTWGELGTALAGIHVQIEGEEHLWSQRPAVFVFNHQSAIDALLLCRVLRRDFVGIGKKEIENYPLLGRAFRYVGTVFVDRGSTTDAVAALGEAVAVLQEGTSIAIAPEGTRSATTKLGKFKKGAFHLAMRAGVPIVPVVFVNAHDALPKHGLVIRAATVRVVVHPPISTLRWTSATLATNVEKVRTLFSQTLGDTEEG
jgi:putative phosphoserine phosphatase/1-acylglycerol-3-phosphate O-acyltransferase